MTKYDVLVYHRDADAFLERLQELGLVDVTVRGWQASADDTALLGEVTRRREAVARLRTKRHEMSDREVTRAQKQTASAWVDYQDATAHLDDLDARIAAAEKRAEQVGGWGDFDLEALRELQNQGVAIKFYTLGGENFATIGELPEGARETATPTTTAKLQRTEIKTLQHEREEWERVLARAAAGVDALEKETDAMASRLDLRRVASAAEKPVEGSLMLLEGWARRETAAEVEQFLDGAGVYYIASSPTPDDEVPVVLRNRKWSSPFEVIGNFYSLPKYGTIDLTAFFGPFYMIFFGFCLGDAGYGLMFVLGGLFLWKKHRQIAMLTLLCGVAAVGFGFLVGSFFGAGLGKTLLTSEMLFALSLGLGVIQILFAQVLKIVGTSAQFGFKYALGTLGWVLVVCAFVYMMLPNAGLHKLLTAVTVTYPVNMTTVYALMITGLVLMLFFHTPRRNPLANLGGGLWNTYNDVTGLLGDLLSYIRLFALCLSGGTLALVFNKLALAMPIPVAIVVLVLGHGLNLFMSALGSFVHPMRLTFVEFYKNAGFEAAERTFSPFSRQN